VVYFSI